MRRKFEFVERKKRKKDDEYKTCMKLPERSTKKSAGYDFYAVNDVLCESHKITMIPTGIKAKMEDDETLLLFNRSSNPKKKGLIILNGVGVIDADYYGNADNDGEIAALFYNMRDEDVEIKAGDKIMQGIFVKYAITEDDKAEGERQGGFGSTGK